MCAVPRRIDWGLTDVKRGGEGRDIEAEECEEEDGW